MERLYMETQDGLKTTALTLFLNLFFHFLPAATLCDDFSLVDSVRTYNAETNSFFKLNKDSRIFHNHY